MDIDDEACAAGMRRYRLATKREAVNFALRSLASEPLSLEEARPGCAEPAGKATSMRCGGAALILVDTFAWVKYLRNTGSPVCI